MDELSETVKIITYCEGNQEVAQLVDHLLSQQGFQVTSTTNQEECLKQVATVQPDLVVITETSEQTDEWAILWKVKERVTRQTPVLGLINRQVPFSVPSISNGAFVEIDDYIWYPFGPLDLANSIQRLLKRKRAYRLVGKSRG